MLQVHAGTIDHKALFPLNQMIVAEFLEVIAILENDMRGTI